MNMYRFFILCIVFSFVFAGCKKKQNPADAASALCACNDSVASINAEMTAAAGDAAKLKDIATRHTAAMTDSANCIKETVKVIGASLKKEQFKTDMLDAMGKQCPQVEKLYSKFIY